MQDLYKEHDGRGKHKNIRWAPRGQLLPLLKSTTKIGLHRQFFSLHPACSNVLVMIRGAVDAERSRVHFSWKPILYSFKKMCQPERMSRQQSRASINVTNLEPKHDKCRDFVFSGLGSALYQAFSSNFIQPCVQKSVRKLIPFVDV